MAARRWYIRQAIFTGLSILALKTSAQPSVAFPFNSQVPVVARVGQPYTFQFSQSTFAPHTSAFTYALVGQPAWLRIDSAARLLLGLPTQDDAGASTFFIVATDASGATAEMGCTMVVSADPPPVIEGDFSKELAATANLSSTQPPIMTVLPSTPFNFDFKPSSFIDAIQRKLWYYATLANHTPLPSWLKFDADNLVFTGTAPQLSAFPQSWHIDLIVSDVEGFAGAKAAFTIAIGIHKLVFVPEEQQFAVTPGKKVDLTTLGSTLFLNGNEYAPGNSKNVQASPPAWLHLDKKTLDVTGTVPPNAKDENFTISVEDGFGNTATVLVDIVTSGSSLFAGTVGTLIADSGQAFKYHFSHSLFAKEDLDLAVTFPATESWLHFDSQSRTLVGEVPKQSASSTIQATLTASSADSAEAQDQVFTIYIRGSDAKTGSVVPGTSTPSPGSALAKVSDSRITGGAIAGIVVAVLVAAILIAVLVFLCWRRRKDQQSYVESPTPSRRINSRSILSPEADAILVTTDVQTDIEKTGGEHIEPDDAHGIALELSSQVGNTRLKWSKRFSRLSLASSIGNGEGALQADSNIPELGRKSSALAKPHDSFSVPAEMARSSRQLTDAPPSKRIFKRIKEKRYSRSSVGLGIDTRGAGLLPDRSVDGSKSKRRRVSSLGLSAAMDRSSAGSISTRGTSVLSTKPSDFPRPPTRSTLAGSRSIPALYLTEAEKHASIRLVDRSDSNPGDRSMQEKRQSYIRNRASTMCADPSPLFAHGSRASSDASQSVRVSAAIASASRTRRPRRGKSQLATCSESSSIGPQATNPKRLSSRLRSTFAPSFPRAITASSLEADDEGGLSVRDSDSFHTTSSPMEEADLAATAISEAELRAQMVLPKHLRDWRTPAESLTPSPTTMSRQTSMGRRSLLSDEYEPPRQKWRDRLQERSASPLTAALSAPVVEELLKATAPQAQKSTINEPLSLVSNDSLSRAKVDRTYLSYAASADTADGNRPNRLSNLHADADDARPGSEMYEAMELAGKMPPTSNERRDGTQKSNMSGPAFL